MNPKDIAIRFATKLNRVVVSKFWSTDFGEKNVLEGA